MLQFEIVMPLERGEGLVLDGRLRVGTETRAVVVRNLDNPLLTNPLPENIFQLAT